MKKNIIYVLLGLALISSCEKDEVKVYSSDNPKAPVFLAPDDGSVYLLQKQDSDKLIYFTWVEADYGFPTVINYMLQFDTIGGVFKKPSTVSNTTNDTSEVKYKDLNKKILAYKLKAGQQKTVRIRVRALVNDKLDTLYSNEIKLNVTPY